MQCFRPISIRDPSGKEDFIKVSCGKCFACQSNRRKDWHLRIKYEMFHSVVSYTVTLTYDDEHLPDFVPYYDKSDEFASTILYYYHPFCLDHVQRFHKRLRKHNFRFRYFGVAEFGSKRGRPHYHIIYFFDYNQNKLEFVNEVFKEWYYGSQITVDETNDDCIGYTLKYCLKPFTSSDPLPKIFLSKKPVIGQNYLSDSTLKWLRENPGDVVTTMDGYHRIPRTFRDKIYDDDMKEVNKELLQMRLDEKFLSDCRLADSMGISYSELLLKRRSAFTSRCWKQIKKKSL